MPTISLLGVSKFFGGAQALDGVDLVLEPGTVHALVGENGAGKSTALKVLAGLEQPSSGRLTLDGVAVAFSGRRASIDHGVGLVPQQLSLNPEMTLVENFVLTRPALLAHRREAQRILERVAADAGLAVPLRTPVRQLALAQRQLGELAIALAQGARILLLDEPTSALGPYESDALFEKIAQLAADGVAALLITHRIAEVRSVARDVTVLSHGRVTLSARVADVTDDDLVTAMVGQIPAPEAAVPFVHGADVLVLDDVVLPGFGGGRIDLTVRSGEIVGVLGVAGNGQGALADTAAGVTAPGHGRVLVNGVEVAGRPQRADRAGVAYVPEVRADFLLPDLPLTHSAVLRRLRDARFTRAGLMRWKAVRVFTDELLERHDVRPRNASLAASSLSGGNQQKFLVGRELDGAPAVAVLHGPTQGLDLYAASAIRSEIRSAAAQGTAVLLVSADIDEVRDLADRVVVLSKGGLADEFEVGDFDVQRVGRAMAGLATGA
ncbi:ABC transporter ATP-binding protein [Subtercola sp. YIM 133946]|uniref:ABC transporter ATP-binding protein n=1 Tax=Subtercola sp. YIM 133946 TaxID=3118909 RepID=UPI002F921760